MYKVTATEASLYSVVLRTIFDVNFEIYHKMTLNPGYLIGPFLLRIFKCALRERCFRYMQNLYVFHRHFASLSHQLGRLFENLPRWLQSRLTICKQPTFQSATFMIFFYNISICLITNRLLSITQETFMIAILRGLLFPN